MKHDLDLISGSVRYLLGLQLDYVTKFGGARHLVAAEGQLRAGCTGHRVGSPVKSLFKTGYGRGLSSILSEIIPFNDGPWKECKFIISAISSDSLYDVLWGESQPWLLYHPWERPLVDGRLCGIGPVGYPSVCLQGSANQGPGPLMSHYSHLSNNHTPLNTSIG